MTDVMFHVGAPDRLAYACRLLRKALARGSKAAVTAPAATLAHLDRLLWTFEPLEFLPHVHLPAGGTVAARLAAATPLWLVERASDAPCHEVLVNLGDEVAPGFERFLRLIEIVPAEDGARQAARQRWKHYADRGYKLSTHEVKMAGADA